MEFTKEINEDQTAIITIKGSLCVSDTEALREEFIQCFEHYRGLTLNLNEVVDCDTAGVQLLYSANQTALESDKHFSIEAISEAVQEALHRIGLDLQELTTKLEEPQD